MKKKQLTHFLHFQLLVDFVSGHEKTPSLFQLNSNFPRRTYQIDAESTLTIEDAGICSSTILFVQGLTDESSDDEQLQFYSFCGFQAATKHSIDLINLLYLTMMEHGKICPSTVKYTHVIVVRAVFIDKAFFSYTSSRSQLHLDLYLVAYVFKNLQKLMSQSNPVR